MAVTFYAPYACQTCSFMSAITYEASRTSNKSTTEVQTMDSYIHRHRRNRTIILMLNTEFYTVKYTQPWWYCWWAETACVPSLAKQSLHILSKMATFAYTLLSMQAAAAIWILTQPRNPCKNLYIWKSAHIPILVSHVSPNLLHSTIRFQTRLRQHWSRKCRGIVISSILLLSADLSGRLPHRRKRTWPCCRPSLALKVTKIVQLWSAFGDTLISLWNPINATKCCL